MWNGKLVRTGRKGYKGTYTQKIRKKLVYDDGVRLPPGTQGPDLHPDSDTTYLGSLINGPVKGYLKDPVITVLVIRSQSHGLSLSRYFFSFEIKFN